MFSGDLGRLSYGLLFETLMAFIREPNLHYNIHGVIPPPLTDSPISNLHSNLSLLRGDCGPSAPDLGLVSQAGFFCAGDLPLGFYSPADPFWGSPSSVYGRVMCNLRNQERAHAELPITPGVHWPKFFGPHDNHQGCEVSIPNHSSSLLLNSVLYT